MICILKINPGNFFKCLLAICWFYLGLVVVFFFIYIDRFNLLVGLKDNCILYRRGCKQLLYLFFMICFGTWLTITLLWSLISHKLSSLNRWFRIRIVSRSNILNMRNTMMSLQLSYDGQFQQMICRYWMLFLFGQLCPISK